ncbi:MAG: hypothetical protein UHM85_06505 [Acutalibacteraceae bacterium]|nr:hypothetical protein [Acutalibacteraceae bacterium]
MRTLTIKRAKKYVGWMTSAKIYIEDPISGDTVINSVPCRKLGNIKNGEEKSFTIGNEAARVFAAADRFSKNISNDLYELPAGEDDIYLTGANRYNLTNGNIFVFDNNTSEEALLNRKKSKKKYLILLAVAAVIGFIFGFASVFFGSEPVAETFTCDEMSIVLTDEFIETSADGYDAIYSSGDVVVLVMKEDFAVLEGLEDYSTEEYCKLVLENGSKSDAEITTKDGISYFTYQDEDIEYNYEAFAYKTDKSFWLIQFSTDIENMETYDEQIDLWVNSITFE